MSKVRKKWVLTALLLASSLASSGGAETSPQSNYQDVVLVNPLEAIIPPELRALQLENPSVKFHVIVNPDGTILDSLAIEATHFGLLDAAEKKLEKARFRPATLEGTPVNGKITVIITFFDPVQRAWLQGGINAPLGVTVSEAVERRIYSVSKASFIYSESEVSQLDHPLKLIKSELKMLHPEGQPMPQGRVVVEYAIDHKGRVRMPSVLETDGKFLSLSALMTLQETVFSPPTRNGNPTFVRVRQPFNFD